MSIVARLEGCILRPDCELAELIGEATGDGAVVSFTGIARPRSSSGESVDVVVLEHHPVLTQKSLEEIAVAATERFDVTHVRVVHRFGEVPAGEPIVFAGAASPHRRAAFDAADYLMDRLKTEAIFWKRETGEAGSRWIEPTETDFSDRERWG
jgi:molybdopterin synthase catalytic subunit